MFDLPLTLGNGFVPVLGGVSRNGYSCVGSSPEIRQVHKGERQKCSLYVLHTRRRRYEKCIKKKMIRQIGVRLTHNQCHVDV